MPNSLSFILVTLFISILLIILLTTQLRVHAFFALIIACFFVGIVLQIPIGQLITTIKDGFGNILKSIGLIIVFGTALGILLEYAGCTEVLAQFILKKTGEKRAALAMNITGFLVGLPIFCDSGFIVLSGLNKSFAKRTGIPLLAMSTSLATGLYAVHCLIPPHPGAAAAAGIIGIDFGRVILFGILIAIPSTAVGYLYTRIASAKMKSREEEDKFLSATISTLPPVWKAILPILVPILLIAIKSFFQIESADETVWYGKLFVLGDPVIAIAIGIILTFFCKKKWSRNATSKLLQEAAEKAGGILVIIGAGGAFGATLAFANIGMHVAESIPLAKLGILFPFLLTFILKTSQGSSTVAIITAASIVQPLLQPLGMNTANGQLLAVLSMGAGSMMISHANDAYFWVITKFSGLEMKPMLKVYSLATLIMGLTSIAMVFILKYILLN
jgi:GntP family gluconate:H+ symporter